VPFEFIDAISLLGPTDRIAERIQAYADAGVTTLSIATYAGPLEERLAAVRAATQAMERAGVGA